MFNDCPIPGCECAPLQALVCPACGVRGRITYVDEEILNCEQCGASTDLFEIQKKTDEVGW